MPVLESSIEGSCKRWVEKKGGMFFKIQQSRGWPDRLIVKPNGHVMFVEFKAPGKKLRELQSHMLHKLLEFEVAAYWVTSLDEFKGLYDSL